MTTTGLKLSVTAERTMFGKRSGQFVATLGPWTARGTTKDEATMILEQRLVDLERWEHTRRYLACPDGTVFCLFHEFNGWAYDMAGGGRNTPSTTVLGDDYQTYMQALDAMTKHWTQYCEQAVVTSER